MSAAEEPRRSVRATKGQHKALEQDQSIEAPKRRGRKKKSQQEHIQEEPEEEVIRCVCGATEQDEDSGEPWIACDKCGAWQHNVCMGMSVYSEDLLIDYFCELCKPQDHKELLDGIARGEKPWEARRQAYEEEQEKKKKRGPKKGKGKRLSGDKDDGTQTPTKSKASPAPALEVKKEAKPAAGTKRKSRAGSQDDSETPQKLRKVTESQAVPITYTPPDDLPTRIAELLDTRQGPAKALQKSLLHAIASAEKKGIMSTADGTPVEARAERLAIQIERAVHDTHPNHKEYASQVRTLAFNLKNNNELYARLANRTLAPPTLAVMTTDELASKEMQREKAEMKARADKQSILVTDDGPRVRRTHKGEEMIGDDGFAIPSDETPSVVRRQSMRASQAAEPSHPPPEADHHDQEGQEVELPAHINTTHVDTQSHSPRADFDINKVFSSVKSPTAAHNRRPSMPAGPSPTGPGVDPEVDRMLRDDGHESPPYSPSEEVDPDVLWKGTVIMNSIASLHATAKHVGGANLKKTIGISWNALLPKRLHVAGRIDTQKAIEYLCSLRYSAVTDIMVVNLTPASEPAKVQFKILFEYFVSKNRYGVVGEKGTANVRDTYLVPIRPGTGGHPEFMLNLVDNFIPETRSEPMLLLVVVYRNSPDALEKLRTTDSSGQLVSQLPVGHTPAPGHHRAASVPAPAFSPTSPQSAFPHYSTPRNGNTPSQPQQHRSQAAGAQNSQLPGPGYKLLDDPSRAIAQQEGEAIARQILGPLVNSPTLNFLLPQAYQMRQKEWEVIRRILERDPRARDDLQHLSILLEKEGRESNAQSLPSNGGTAPLSSPGNAPVPAPFGTAPPQSQRTPIPPPVIPPQTGASPVPRKLTPIPPPPIPPQAAPAPPT